MINNNKVLVVIPARGGSKKIPRRNARLLGDKPLISYSIDVAKSCEYVDDVVVSSADDEILRITELFGAQALRRPQELASYETSIFEVVYEAMLKKESLIYDEYDIIITMMPNVPLLKPETLSQILERFSSNDFDTIISVRGDSNLYWIYDNETKSYRQSPSQRENLEFLPKTFQETGNVVASRRSFITPESNIGQNIDLFEVSIEESVQVNTFDDWGIANNYLNRHNVAIVVGLEDRATLDNIDRCLSVSSKLFFHNVKFFLGKKDYLTETVDRYSYQYTQFRNESDLISQLKEFNPDIILNDIGDTTAEYMEKLKELDCFIANFGDLGHGFEFADIVFDDLYEHKHAQDNIFIGKDYFILKDRFYFNNKKISNEEIKDIVLFFEGNDLNNLTERLLNIIIKTGLARYIYVVLGIDYSDSESFINKYQIYNNVIIYNNPKNLQDVMYKSDLAFMSAGRAMYEACSIGLPTVILCQDEREVSHIFASNSNGFINLGLASEVSDELIVEKINFLANNQEYRIEMQNKMLSIDLKYGFENVWSEIKKSFRKFSLNKKE